MADDKADINYENACKEIAALKAERDELKASLSHERAKFYNERDALTLQVVRWKCGADELYDSNERLRAALEKIIKSEWLGSADTKMLAIARRELEKDQER